MPSEDGLDLHQNHLLSGTLNNSPRQSWLLPHLCLHHYSSPIAHHQSKQCPNLPSWELLEDRTYVLFVLVSPETQMI